jgi:hypothetical protein
VAKTGSTSKAVPAESSVCSTTTKQLPIVNRSLPSSTSVLDRFNGFSSFESSPQPPSSSSSSGESDDEDNVPLKKDESPKNGQVRFK